MAHTINVSFPDSEKELWEWLESKQFKKELSPSLVFRDALKELKRQDEIKSSTDSVILSRRLEESKKLIAEFQEFIEKKGLNEDWFNFKAKEMEKELFTKKGIETIEIDKNKEKPT